ncbi:MAG TPA: toprim domain-containing protein, partial [Steroidobacteraceae bacterium]|nr:toprim domain-containing protein [Steroidobacteraceae bacterium]
FGIGYAPAAWDAVLSRFGRDEHARRQLHAVGLIVERERAERSGPGPQRGYYDRFRDRIMFPIRDSRGRTIGFGGRVLDRGEPKYLNSPESELFHKGRELYGLYEARKATRSLSRLLVVEGYMDVVRLHQAGLTYAVATLGTATTPDHLTRLFRATNEVVFCFDGDRAGRAAAWRALTNALGLIREGRQVRFLFLPEGQDPDSLVGAEGAEAFEARLATAVPLSEVLIRDLKMRFDTASVDGRAQLAEAARPLLQKLPAGVYRELLTAEIARTVGMPEQRFEALLDAAAGPAPSPAIQGERGRPRPVSSGPGSTGRRNLVRQAIHLLVHHPGAALAIADHESLGIVDRPGVPLLVQLLTELRDDPAGSTGQLLERWRGRPDYESLAKLAARECLVPDLTGARLELQEAVARLIREEAPGRRLDVLLEKSRAAPLSEEEKHELQGLLQATATARTHRES